MGDFRDRDRDRDRDRAIRIIIRPGERVIVEARRRRRDRF